MALPQGYSVADTFQAQNDAKKLIGALSLVSLAMIFISLCLCRLHTGLAVVQLRGGMIQARVPLFCVAHSGSGDKDDSQTVSLISYDRASYTLLAAAVTPAAVRRQFGLLVQGWVRRYDLPLLAAFSFVLDGALEGGVNDRAATPGSEPLRAAISRSLPHGAARDGPA